MSAVSLPPEAWAASLAALPGMGPARLRALLEAWSPEQAWHAVVEGRAHRAPVVAGACGPRRETVVAAWRAAAAVADPAAAWAALRARGAEVSLLGQPRHPFTSVPDPDPPAVLFTLGHVQPALERPRVAIVGTRRATPYGRAVARALGADLAAAGVAVVSGLAAGIDGAAHVGALEGGGAAPVAVVGSGLDVPYPRANAALWREVAEVGALLSEAPLGGAPEAWRFPARNRIIAGLSHVVVVVESRATGGSMHTVAAALERDRTVMAVPGSVRSPASEGTNHLLVEGAAPARDAGDVLVALGLSSAPSDAAAARAGRPSPDAGPHDTSARLVLDALGGEPATLDQVAARLGEPLGPVAAHLTRLADGGWVAREGVWWQRVK